MWEQASPSLMLSHWGTSIFYILCLCDTLFPVKVVRSISNQQRDRGGKVPDSCATSIKESYWPHWSLHLFHLTRWIYICALHWICKTFSFLTDICLFALAFLRGQSCEMALFILLILTCLSTVGQTALTFSDCGSNFRRPGNKHTALNSHEVYRRRKRRW